MLRDNLESEVQYHGSREHPFETIARHFIESYRGTNLCKLKIVDMVTLDLVEIKNKCPNLVAVKLESPWSYIGWSEELHGRRDWIRSFENVSIQNPRDEDTTKNREFRQYMYESRNSGDGIITLAKSRYEGIQIFEGEGEAERIEWLRWAWPESYEGDLLGHFTGRNKARRCQEFLYRHFGRRGPERCRWSSQELRKALEKEDLAIHKRRMKRAVRTKTVHGELRASS